MKMINSVKWENTTGNNWRGNQLLPFLSDSSSKAHTSKDRESGNIENHIDGLPLASSLGFSITLYCIWSLL